ncbi:antitoxin CptB [Aliiroseovarius halocynthiae]|uniref:FAD assembly factor SdhE n=1 Tax=Aliiroseovarius halocynthiae TaxID=985055 RepID=A0A545SSK5_9RHOB|nr:succinate dehydrogenase assembly factor 2 [Aliiroseovarius halocynthiae]TQV67906.1 succinate dehydrogenase assembly factor 2 [Aliiroseovarius halocynthiae]SMR73005.1 antitoxin CptB [Aliiroseovarius halocynthiae]
MSGIHLDQLKETPGAREGETHEHRVKRLAMRSMRRGIKEMDIILSRYADDHLDGMRTDELDLYEALLGENDQDLYQWVSGQQDAPAGLSDLVARIAEHMQAR